MCLLLYECIAYIHLSFVDLLITHPELIMSIVQVIIVRSSLKAKTLSKPEPVQTGTKLCPQGFPICTGFTVYQKNADYSLNRLEVV